MPEPQVELLERLKKIVDDLESVIYGNSYLRTPGLLNDLDSLKKDIIAIRRDVEEIKNRRPHMATWLLGFAALCGAIIFGTISIFNGSWNIVTRIPADLAGWIAAVLVVAAVVLLISGEGWLGRD